VAGALLIGRRMVVNKLRDIENGVRAALRESGIKLSKPGRKQFAERVRTLTADDPVLATLVEPLLSIIITMTRELARLTKQVLLPDSMMRRPPRRPRREASDPWARRVSRGADGLHRPKQRRLLDPATRGR
jgi:hypothetical protein